MLLISWRSHLHIRFVSKMKQYEALKVSMKKRNTFRSWSTMGCSSNRSSLSTGREPRSVFGNSYRIDITKSLMKWSKKLTWLNNFWYTCRADWECGLEGGCRCMSGSGFCCKSSAISASSSLEYTGSVISKLTYVNQTDFKLVQQCKYTPMFGISLLLSWIGSLTTSAMLTKNL